MIISRYLLREIVGPLAIVLSVLAVLFTSYGAAGFLSDAVNGLLPTNMIVQVIGLRTLIALEVLIPIALFFAVVMALGRLYADSEITALFALGVSPARVLGVVLGLSLFTALAVAGLSLLVRPWAYSRAHELASLAAASLNTRNMEAGTFYVGGDGNRTIFLEGRDGPSTPGHGVFVELRNRDGGTRVIYARSIEEVPHIDANGSQMRLADAHVYDFSQQGGGSDVALHVNNLVLELAGTQAEPPEYSAVAASTADLASSHSAADTAELQWRLSTSWSALLLGLLAVPLSRSRPRQHKQARLGIAILIYAGYYLLYESVRTWVQIGVFPAFPGLWVAPALLALILIAALFGPRLAVRLRYRAAE
ncbi:MAG TPA: LPS export ABC transporter permease LptF [Steroidobacteraceae bacterium]